MSAGPSSDLESAARTVKLLDEQAANLRLELFGLQQTLAELERELAKPRAAELVLANEQLVLAALHAERIADTAVGKLDELVRTSQRDALTGTPNRTLMLDRINSAITLARRHRSQCALMFLDIDNFKHINDEFGHEVGDEIIILVARRLRGLVRESDTVGRHGGDEFLVLLAEVQAADVHIVASKVAAELGKPCTVKGYALSLTVSIGIALFPEDGDDAPTLISRADAAMYHSKRNGAGGFEFHSPQIATARMAAARDTATMRAITYDAAQSIDTSRLRDLCAANERLVLGALAAQEQQIAIRDAHLRQIKFIAMVAHELRSPLAPLGTAAELLRHAVTDKSLLVRLQAIIKRQVAHVARLVDDLLDGSRATTGTFRLERISVDMAAIIANAADLCRPSFVTRQQTFRLQLPPDSLLVLGDAVRLSQVLSNLLDNASKYTPTGGTITLSATVDNHWLRLIVADNGIGISAAAQASIFDLFVQEDHAVSVNRTGLGIGLAVVRELIKGHGGEVSCASPGRGLGSQFTVLLPLLRAPADLSRQVASS